MFRRKKKSALIKKVALIKKASFFSKHFQTTLSCSLKQKLIEADIKFATEVNFNKSKKKKIGSTILLIFNFLVIAGVFIYYGLTSETVHVNEFFTLDIKWVFLGLAVLSLVMHLSIEGLRYFQLIKKSTGRKNYWLALKTHMLGSYYDNITPFAVGGQPFQVFYLNKHGIKGEKATSIPIVEHMFSAIACLIISIVVLIANIFCGFATSPLIIIFAIIGLFANGMIIGLLLLFSINKRVGPAFVIKILKLLNKLHIIKDYKTTFFKVSRFVKNYQKSMKEFTKSKSTVFFQILAAFASSFFLYGITYCIHRAFAIGGAPVVSYFEIASCSVFCVLCSSIMPLPGGSGLAEISFDTLLGRWFAGGLFTWALLIWRCLTYFVYIVVGGLQVFISYLKTVIKNKKKIKQRSYKKE